MRIPPIARPRRPAAFTILFLVFAGIVSLPALAAGPILGPVPGPGTLLDAGQAHAWRGVGRVNVGGLSTRGLCTGTLIAPDVVLTVAHCVVQRRTGRPHRLDSLFFVAGWRRGAMTGSSVAAAVAVHPLYRARNEGDGALASDLALLRLRDPLTSAAAMPFTVAAPPPPGAPIVVVSYRRDRPHALTYQDDCTYEARRGALLILRCAVASGASGAPVLAEIGGKMRVIATLVAMNRHGQAFAVQAEGAVRKLLVSLQNTGTAPPSH
jgi:V8-like Glu-specific endopeptidase